MTRKDGSQGLEARGYSWAPFEEGNTVALVHGGNSQRAIAAKAIEVHETLIDHAPYLAEAIFAPQVNRYLQATAREQLLHEYIIKLSDDKGPQAVPSRVWEQSTAATRLAAKLADDLGLSPRGHAELKAIAASAETAESSLSDLRRRGAEITARKAAQFAALDAEQKDADGAKN